MKALIIVEHTQQQMHPSILSVVGAASRLNVQIDLLVVGHQCDAVANQVAQIAGVSAVYQMDHPAYTHQLPENTAQVIAAFARDYQYVLAAATTCGKNLLPRVAALLDVAQISDVLAIEGNDTFVRPIYAGNILATVQAHDAIKVLTIRTTAFAAAAMGANKAPITKPNVCVENAQTRFVRQELSQSTRPELTAARVIVSGGRGLQSGENFKLLEALADRLGAAIGASRAAVDAGFVPNDYQVGQTGKIVAPELYIAIGISGAIQHLAGMKDSKVIVAINKDSEAPIFHIADYGLVGDLFKIVPELLTALEK